MPYLTSQSALLLRLFLPLPCLATTETDLNRVSLKNWAGSARIYSFVGPQMLIFHFQIRPQPLFECLSLDIFLCRVIISICIADHLLLTNQPPPTSRTSSIVYPSEIFVFA